MSERGKETGKERDGEREGERKEYVRLSGLKVSGVTEWRAFLMCSLTFMFSRYMKFLPTMLTGSKFLRKLLVHYYYYST